MVSYGSTRFDFQPYRRCGWSSEMISEHFIGQIDQWHKQPHARFIHFGKRTTMYCREVIPHFEVSDLESSPVYATLNFPNPALQVLKNRLLWDTLCLWAPCACASASICKGMLLGRHEGLVGFVKVKPKNRVQKGKCLRLMCAKIEFPMPFICKIPPPNWSILKLVWVI